MPEYVWVCDETGEIIERVYKMSDPRPDRIYARMLGKQTDWFEGDPIPQASPVTFMFHRDFSVMRVNGMEHVTYPRASLRLQGRLLPEDAPHQTIYVETKYGRRSRDNVPIIKSRQHERELEAKYRGILERE